MNLRRAGWIGAFGLAGICAARGAPVADPQLPTYAAPARLAGTLLVARCASTDTLVAAWITQFHALAPGVTVRQTERSTDLPAASLQQLVAGTVQVAPFVREIQSGEAAAAQASLGYPVLGVAVASGSYATPSNTHAIAFYVNAANPLARLTLVQLDAIYSAERRRGAAAPIVTWGGLGLTGEWADRPIHAYSMVTRRKVGNPHAGIVAYLMERLMLGGEFRSDLREEPDTGMGRGNNRALDEIAAAVAADPAAIGYAGFANARAGIKPLALAEGPGQPFYAGTPEEVARRLYPLTRTIFIFVRRPPGRPLDPALREFLLFVLSRAGQASVAADAAHFLPLPAAFAAGERAKL